MAAAEGPTRPTGRPSIYSEELVDTICERIALGESLNRICKDDGMPDMATVLRWLARDDREDFRAKYARARVVQADTLADEITDIADEAPDAAVSCDPKAANAAVNAIRVRVDARKWIASKLRPAKYGERLGISAPDGGPVGLTFVDLAKSAAED